MVKRITPIRITSFLLLAACGALCQSERRSDGSFQGLQFERSNSPEPLRLEMRTEVSLPDAPSTIQPPKRAEKFQTFVDRSPTPLTLGAVGINGVTIRETGVGRINRGMYRAVFTQEESSTFLGKYFYSSLLKQSQQYHTSTSGSFMGRATYAASRILITRNDVGKGRLNTAYFLGVLTSVAIHTAYRPYWSRSGSETFNNLGSTIGSDAGINLFHEFRPDIRQMMRGHTPKFMSRIEERSTQAQTPREGVSTAAR